MKFSFKRTLWIAAGVGSLVALFFAFQPQPVLVDLARIERGELRVTVDDDGITRVRERYTISAPIQARLVRTVLDAGDRVEKGETVIAEFAPAIATPLDQRSRAEATARFERAVAAVKEADARHKQASVDLTFYQRQLEQARELVGEGIRAADTLDRAVRDEQRASEGLRAAQFQHEMARFSRDLTRASLRDPRALADDPKHEENPGTRRRPLFLRAPVSGHVLRVFEKSARTVPAGTPILEIGDLGRLEIVADYLSQDAVLVRPGMPVRIEGWGGERLAGVVRLVEPSGFTKISALGVEEQRVNILVDPRDPAEWAPLRDGFRVELRIEIWSAEDELLVSTGALFRKDGSWAVFVVVGGTARFKRVRLGRRTGLRAQVLEGLMAGDEVILYPSDLIVDGQAVAGR